MAAPLAPADCSSAAMPTKAPHTALSEAGAEAEEACLSEPEESWEGTVSPSYNHVGVNELDRGHIVRGHIT